MRDSRTVFQLNIYEISFFKPYISSVSKQGKLWEEAYSQMRNQIKIDAVLLILAWSVNRSMK